MNFLRKIGRAFDKNVIQKAAGFVEDHPLLATALVVGGGVYFAGLGAAGAAGSFVGPPTAAQAAAGAVTGGGAMTAGGSTGILATMKAGGAGMAETLFGTPARSMLTATALNVGGSMLTAQSQMDEQRRIAEEGMQFQREMFGRQAELQKTSYAPTSGILGQQRRAGPVQMTPQEALRMRRTGVL